MYNWLRFKRIFSGVILTISMLMSPIAGSPVSAHPLDISTTSFTLESNTIQAVTYFHPSQVEATIGSTGVSMRSLTYWDYYKYSGALEQYLRKKVTLRDSKWALCPLENFTTQDLGVDDIFTRGFPVSYSAKCSNSLERMQYSVSIYRELPLQTNRVRILGSRGDSLAYRVLTARITDGTYDPSDTTRPLDADGDRLSDDEEVAYRTDPKKADTDNDYYSDGEEVNFGWNPLDARLSPGQSYRRSAPEQEYIIPDWVAQLSTSDSVQKTTTVSYDNTTISSGDTTGVEAQLNSKSYWFFTQWLKFIDQIRKEGLQSWFIVPLLWAIFLLWLLHALGPWHSKGFMASYILSTHAGYARSVLYAGIFTLVHLLDVIILIVVSKYVFEFFDPTHYLTIISQVAAVTLVGVSLLVGGLALRSLLRRNTVWLIEPSGWSLRIWLSMAFLSGLAPCTFAWSLLLVLFAIGRMDLALPLVGVFGLGVFITLAGVAIIVTYCKLQLTSRYRSFAKYAQVASAVMLLVLSLLLASQVF